MTDILRKTKMAKYTRFDPRNRKYGRNKKQSIDKDIRIKKTTNKLSHKITRVALELIYDK